MKEHQRSRLYWLIVENRVNMSDTKISHEGHFITLNLAGALYAQHSSAPHGNVCYAYLLSLSVQCTRLYVHAWVRACVRVYVYNMFYLKLVSGEFSVMFCDYY